MANKRLKALEKYEPWPDNWRNYTYEEKVRYVKVFKERCQTGYAGLTGVHYFYCMVGHLKTPTGKIIRPMIRDMDMNMNEEFLVAKRDEEDFVIAKRRGYALTSMFSGYAMFMAMTIPNTVSLLTSADATRLEDMYVNKLKTFYQHMPDGLKEPIIRKRQGKALHFGIQDPNDPDSVIGLNSQILCLETADGPSSPSKFEAARAIFAFLDEAALHPYADKVVAVAQSTISDDGLKLNPFVLGGSAGVANPKGLKMMRELWFDPKSGYRKLFIEGWWCMNRAGEIDNDGNLTGKEVSFMYEKNGIWYSDIKRAKAWIEKKRAILFKAKNKTKYYQFCKAYPTSTADYFDIMAEGAFTEDIQNIIIDSSARILHEPPTWVKHYIYTKGDKVFGEPSEHGFVDILIPPRKDTVYGGGVDPIPFGDDKMETVKGSDCALIISPYNDAVPHALYRKKSQDSDTVANEMILVQRWYNDTKALFERNRGGVLMSKYVAAGFAQLLANQPTWFGPQYYDQKFRYGYYYGTGTMDKVEDELVAWIKSDLVRAKSIELLDDLKVYRKANTDVADAWKTYLTQRRQFFFNLKMSSDGEQEVEETMVTRFGPNGERYEAFVNRILSPQEAAERAILRNRGDYFSTRDSNDDF